MNPAQIRNLVQLVGVTCIAYALYAVWLSFGNLEEPLAAGALPREPFLWIGLALIVGPYVVGAASFVYARTRVRAGALACATGVPSERTLPCRNCRAPVPVSAKVCRTCSEFQA